MAGPTLTSTTSTEAEMTHALSAEWRDPAALPEPAKAPEPEAPETQETEPTPAASEPAEKQPESKPKSKAQRAIDKLTARNYQLAKELEEARKARTADEPKAASPQPPGPPQLKDFKTPEEWADARDAWKEAEAERLEAQRERQAELDEYNRGVSELQGKTDDWEETISQADIEIREYVAAAIVEMGKEGPEVAYYLAKNPDICEELNGMKKFAAIARIHKIAEQLKAPETKDSPKPKTKVTPPAPISTVGASSTRSSTPLDQLSPRDYIAQRNKQEAAKRGR